MGTKATKIIEVSCKSPPNIPSHYKVILDAMLERSRKKGKKLKRLCIGPKEAVFQTVLKIS